MRTIILDLIKTILFKKLYRQTENGTSITFTILLISIGVRLYDRIISYDFFSIRIETLNFVKFDVSSIFDWNVSLSCQQCLLFQNMPISSYPESSFWKKKCPAFFSIYQYIHVILLHSYSNRCKCVSIYICFECYVYPI